jgi:hypothetical protein
MLAIAQSAGLSGPALERVHEGRGTPDEIRALTQAVIDAQPASAPLLNAPTWQPLDVRRLMHDHAVGIDCAGYVQQAYLHATGRTREQVGFQPSILNEGLFTLPQLGFATVPRVAALQPGDIIVFTAPPKSREPGHRTIVFDQRAATDDDQQALRAAPGGRAFASSGTLRVLEMDSSYGSGGFYWHGGVQRQTWILNEATGLWGNLRLSAEPPPETPDTTPNSTPSLRVTSSLYPPDVVLGFYRRRGD